MSDYLVTVNQRWVSLDPDRAIDKWLRSDIFPIKRDLASDLRAGDLLVLNWGFPRRLAAVVSVLSPARDVDLLDMGLSAPRRYVGLTGATVSLRGEPELDEVPAGILSSDLAFEKLSEHQALVLIDWLSDRVAARRVTGEVRRIRSIRLSRAVRDLVTDSIQSDPILRQSWLTWLSDLRSEEKFGTADEAQEVLLEEFGLSEDGPAYSIEDPRSASTEELVDFYDSMVLAPFDFVAAIQNNLEHVERGNSMLRLGDDDRRGASSPLDVEAFMRSSEQFRPQVDILKERTPSSTGGARDMTASLKKTVDDLRAAADQVTGFRKKHIQDKDSADRLFEFSIFFEQIDKLATAMGQKAIIKPGKNRYFARKPGNRSNFNYVELGPFLFYFGVEFIGLSDPATHAPDVALVHKDLPDRVLIAVECKHHSGKTLGKGEVMAFVAVLIDLGRPKMPDSKNRDVIPGLRPFVGILDAPTDADIVRKAYRDGRSYFCTTARTAAANQKCVADKYGFEILLRSFP